MRLFQEKIFRLINLTLVIAFIFVTAMGFAGSACASEKRDASTVVKVDGKKLSQAELDGQVEKILSVAKGQFPPDQIESVRKEIEKNIIENFIQRTVLEEQIRKADITADKTEIDKEMEEIKQSLPPGITLEFALQQTGRSMKEMTEDIAFMVKVNKLLDQKMKEIPEPTPAQIKQFYEGNKDQFASEETVTARHILIRFEDDDDESVKKEKLEKATSIRDRLLKGEEFEKLALNYSDCPSKENGGHLGDFTRGRMVKPFEEAAFSQEINAIGPVVETKFGYHIIQVLDREEASVQSLADATPDIKSYLRDQQKEEFAQKYIKELRDKATITY